MFNMDSASSQRCSLSDLPIGALSHVSSYLPSLPSRALFAVALNCRDIDSSSAIVGEQRDVLDFGGIEKELAARLTDDDVKGVLLSIDAINNLKTLRLTNLLYISGMGLEPLRESTMIEKIDLSLVGDNESPDLSPAPPLSCTEVLPILDSIIHMRGESSLKLLIFPNEWRRERNIDSEFHAFLVRYNQLWRSRVVTCLKCNDNLIEGDSMMDMAADEYGTQNVTCYDCMKHYCHECVEHEDREENYCMSSLCGICNRRYCLHCSREWHCVCCEGWFCVDCVATEQCAHCDEITCSNCISGRGCRNSCCEKVWCNGCTQHSFDLNVCEICDAEYCADCNSTNPYLSAIDYCDDCRKNLCGDCRVFECKNFSNCVGCYQFAFPALLEDKERQRQEMQAEIDQLKRKVKDMSGEFEDNE